MTRKILCVIGTRPEAIKMAPIVLEFQRSGWAQPVVVATAQHRELLDGVLSYFGITPAFDYDVMTANQSLTQLMARMLSELERTISQVKPTAIVAQGDTATTMAASMAAFYGRVPFAHVEAGLRTGDMSRPFPEEANRVITSHMSRWHFAPTASARDNLLRAGIDPSHIEVTGNTVIDALLETASRPAPGQPFATSDKRLVLVTTHRRESFGQPLENICRAILSLAQAHRDVMFLLPVHPNPNVRAVVERLLGDHPSVVLTPPLDYPLFVAAMKEAYIVMTDSGGVQEEAPALGKPVLVLRDETERQEAVDLGVARMVGTNEDAIVAAAGELLSDPLAWQAMAKGVSPYGDGLASRRIVDAMRLALAP